MRHRDARVCGHGSHRVDDRGARTTGTPIHVVEMANTAHAQEQLPPHPMALRKPIKRAASETSTMFEKPATRPSSAARAASTSTSTSSDAIEKGPSFWEHVDGLLESLPVKQAAEAAGAALGQSTKALKNVGRDALASVAALAPRAMRDWRKQAAPPPPTKTTTKSANAAQKERREAVAELGTFIVDLHVEETRAAATAFAKCICDVARLIDDAETAREVSSTRAFEELAAVLGEQSVSEAAAYVPTTRHVVDMFVKRARMTPASFAQAMALVGKDWTSAPSANAGAGKILIESETFALVIDVAFSTFRLRDRASGRAVDINGSLVDEVEADAYFTATHFRIDA